eukprot:1339682-Prorocentrum_lima.AAC.1
MILHQGMVIVVKTSSIRWVDSIDCPYDFGAPHNLNLKLVQAMVVWMGMPTRLTMFIRTSLRT